MNIIAVDDERLALASLQRAICTAAPSAQVTCFSSSVAAFEYAKENPIDIAFLDIEMDGLDGITLAKGFKAINAKTNIIFVSGHSSYMSNAFGIHASGYVLKPVDPKKVAFELNNLRHPVEVSKSNIYFQCFGSFAVFVKGKPVIFTRAKSKEALAYLVDRRGAAVSKKELAAVLWEDEEYTRSVQSHLHILITDMNKTLGQAGAENIIIRNRGNYALDTSKVSCDYFSYENGDISAINGYNGEYMSDYSWAEFTAGQIACKIQTER